ncbi:MAG: glutamine--fructose-6-phosphate transaminase (isomerizing) [Bdellovibrionaceae bacterium]|nr:glutamine--fructose-6-phosphate transaminase (isomerizing) [Pseudobdellovibrionaceae bacterium]
MCGIVGYMGPKDPKDVIIHGLETLEYRGYDSAGISVLNQGKYERIRAQGKLVNLKEKLEGKSFPGGVGIGHTRWATHGAPVEKNAHPHKVYQVNIVHNGIIENNEELRVELKKQGSVFESDTDSELVAHLVHYANDGANNLYEAVIKIISKLEGAYSILVVSEEYPDQIVAFKNGPPLVIGVCDDAREVVIASDIQAIMPYTKDVVYLEDNEVAFLTGESVSYFDIEGKSLDKKVTTIKWDAEQAEKQGYEHFMLKEIYEQPRAVSAAIEPHVDALKNTVSLKNVGFGLDYDKLIEGDLTADEVAADIKSTLDTFKNLERVFIVGCGTSFYAGMVGEYYIENLAKVPVEIELASEFRYRNPIIPKDSLVIFITQSGETADTLAALRQVKSEGVKTLSICNVRRSSIDRESDGHLYMNAGVEVGVASTKAFVTSLAVLNLISISIAKAKGEISEEKESRLLMGLLEAPKHMDSVLAYSHFFSYAADTLKKFKGFLYMGRGVNYPIALEGALKMKELAYKHAEGYAAGEMKHGPLALIDEKMAIVMVAPKDALYDKTLSNLEESKARGGAIISIGTGEDEQLKKLSEHYLSLPEAHWTVNPLIEVIPLQLLSYYVADSLGNDVDRPRNLAKSVTVE